MPQNHQTNHHKSPPRRPITDVPAAKPRNARRRLKTFQFRQLVLINSGGTCDVWIEMIDQNNVGDC